jgi:hypothetical protein
MPALKARVGEGQADGGPRGLPSSPACGAIGRSAAAGLGASAAVAGRTAGWTVNREEEIAAPCPLAGPSSRRTFSIRTRGCVRVGWSATAVVAGLKAEPSDVVRGRPLDINDESKATASASQMDAARSGRVCRSFVIRIADLAMTSR